MSTPKRARAIVCYSDGCPKHEPPEDDCIECMKAFWEPRIRRSDVCDHRAPEGGGR